MNGAPVTTSEPRLMENGLHSQTGERVDERLPLLLLAAFAALVTSALSFAAIRIETLYLNNYGFFFDPAAYYLTNIEVYRFYQENGLWATILNQLANNIRAPGRIIPYLLIAPQSLTSLWSHMWTEMPFAWAFMTLLATTVFNRTRSILMGLAAITMFAGLRLLLNPILGIAAYWLDFTAACALGCAAICMIRYAQSLRLSWMLLFGFFASCAIFCRWTSCAYTLVFVAFAVPLLFAATGKKNWAAAARALGCAAISAIPGLVLLIYGWQANTSYYKSYGYAISQPIANSIAFVSSSLQELSGAPMLSLLALLTVINMLSLVRDKNRALTLLCLSFPLSVFVFLCCIAKVVEAIHTVVFFLPALFIAALCPLPDKVARKCYQFAGAMLLGGSLALSVGYYKEFGHLAKNAPPSERVKKACCAQLAGFIASTKAPTFAELDTETCMPHMDAFFFHGAYCQSLTILSEHELYMRHLYAQSTAPEMARKACARVKNELALVAVFADPQDAMKPGMFRNQYSATVSKGVAEYVAVDPAFKFLTRIDGPRGPLAIYRNTAYRLPSTPAAN